MKLAFAYNLKHSTTDLALDKQVDLDFDSPESIAQIKKILESLGHKILMVEADETAFEKLKANRKKIDLLFNIAEGLSGDARESQIPLFCEILKIPYTHSSPTTHAVKLNKHLAKMVVGFTGVDVPKSIVIKNNKWALPRDLKFPLIVKPNAEGSSKGITNDSIVDSVYKLKKVVKNISSKIPGEIIVEEYIDGREFTVGVIGTPPRVLPIVEQYFDFLPPNLHKIAGYELKWIYEDALEDVTVAYDCPAKIGKRLEKEITEKSLRIFSALNVVDAARIDYRYSKDGKLYFIEINTLPGMLAEPNVLSYFPLAANTGGLDFKDMLAEIIKSACKRWGINK